MSLTPVALADPRALTCAGRLGVPTGSRPSRSTLRHAVRAVRRARVVYMEKIAPGVFLRTAPYGPTVTALVTMFAALAVLATLHTVGKLRQRASDWNERGSRSKTPRLTSGPTRGPTAHQRLVFIVGVLVT